jgi:hypothetical protein
MPFPLAHPAAVLPLRRLPTHSLCFVALMIGSMTPDLSYCLEKYDVDLLAHSVRGCFIFSLPVGWVSLQIFYHISKPLVSLLPSPHRQALLPHCGARKQPWHTVPLSILIGAATHVFWDSFTHETGWFVERSTFLQSALFDYAGHPFRMYRLLWHVSTWVGMVLLYRAYAATLKESSVAATVLSTAEKRRYALWASLLLFPLVGAVPSAILSYANTLSSVTTVPHFLRLASGLYLAILSVLLVSLGTALKIRPQLTD